jgi:ABC-type transporter Mla MlaB component
LSFGRTRRASGTRSPALKPWEFWHVPFFSMLKGDATSECAMRPETQFGGNPQLDIEFVCLLTGTYVRMRGEVVVQTRTALWGAESLLVNEARVTFDFSAVTSIDSAGLETVLSLMDGVRSHGGTVVITCDGLPVHRPTNWNGDLA